MHAANPSPPIYPPADATVVAALVAVTFAHTQEVLQRKEADMQAALMLKIEIAQSSAVTSGTEEQDKQDRPH